MLLNRIPSGARLLSLCVLMVGVACRYEVTPSAVPITQRGVGLALDVINGEPKPLTLLKGQGLFFVQQLRFQVLVTDFAVPAALSWLEQQSLFSTLDWTGIRVVDTDWEVESGSVPSYEEHRGYQGAAWMDQRFSFTLQPLDENNKPLGARVTLSPESFVLTRQTALGWSSGQPTRGENGGNRGQYAALDLSSGGTYTGTEDDIYQLSVVDAGKLDGTARVEVTSIRGDSVEAPVAVQGAVPITLGAAARGATVTFSSTDRNLQLVAGDRWVVRVRPGEAPDAPEAATRANHSAMAEIRFYAARGSAPQLDLPETTRAIAVTWSADRERLYKIPVSFAESKVGYGLEASISLSPPGNLAFYEGGETFTVTVALTDAAGRPLHEAENLPTYAQFVSGDANGIQYFTSSSIPSGHGFFNEARTNIMELSVAGPKQFIEQNYVEGAEPESYFSREHAFPDTGQIAVAGFRDPSLWQTPVPTSVKVKLPEDARQGTYVALLKVQREFMGEPIYRLVDVEFQVGDTQRTDYTDASGDCSVCHIDDARLSRLRHGGNNPQVCVVCHSPRFGVVSEHLHAIHFFSPKYVMPREDCSLCHISPGSNTRASVAVCGACHQAIHPDERIVREDDDPHAACATGCHRDEAAGHVRLPPQ